MQIYSFGCSFTAGTGLISDDTWASLVADRLGLLHSNYGEAGAGNLRIAESVMKHARPGTFCIINWTWIDRFDFVDCLSETWKTVLPVDNSNYAKTYYRYLHSQYRDMLTCLSQAATVIDYLESQQIGFMMTVIDDLWLEPVHPQWHDPRAVTWLQYKLRPHLYDFEGRNFLSWAKQNNYPISDDWHPLDLAHAAAADVMQPIIASILRRA